MKNKVIKPALLLFLLLTFDSTFSQLVFPEGREKKMKTTLDLVYEETKIPFIYPGGRIIDLGWRRLYDSIPSDWFVMACMNGTCIGGVPETGAFDNFLGSPDSIGFLKYHLDFKDVPGTAIIKFIIYKELAMGGSIDTITFNITHVKNNPVQNSNKSMNVSVFPNPSFEFWTIKGENLHSIGMVNLFDVFGKEICTFIPEQWNADFSIQIENKMLQKGIYILRIQSQNIIQSIPLIKN